MALCASMFDIKDGCKSAGSCAHSPLIRHASSAHPCHNRISDRQRSRRASCAHVFVDLAGTGMRSGQSQIFPADGFWLKLLGILFGVGNLGLLAGF